MKQVKSPRLAQRLLRLLLSEAIYSEVEGDLEELFNERVETRGKRFAQIHYWKDVIASVRNSRLRRGYSQKRVFNPMIRHFLKISLRNLGKNKGYAFLNIFGLLAGAVSSLIILQYVFFERSYDTFHESADEIYRIRLDFISGERVQSYATSFPLISELLEKEYPEVVRGGRLEYAYGGNVYESRENDGQVSRYNEEYVFRANQGFWDMFSYELIVGDEAQLFARPNTVAISRTLALKYFGSVDAIGKVIYRNGSEAYEVSGVFEDIPANSHIRFEMLLADTEVEVDESLWRGYNVYNYIQLAKGTDLAAFSADIEEYVYKYREPASFEVRIEPQPLLDIYFGQNILQDDAESGDKRAVDSLYIMALMIMLIAWINFINLSGAAALMRGKEAAMRKVFGSGKRHLFLQSLSEAFVINFVTWVLAIGIAWLLTPLINTRFNLELQRLNFDNDTLLHMGGFLLVGSIISGLYPAFVLTAFKIQHVIQGRNAISSRGTFMRKVLVVVQYSASLALIIITLVVFQQINFMRKADLGINTERTVVIPTPSMRDSTIFAKLETMKERWLALSAVEEVAYGQDVPGRPIHFTFGGVKPVEEAIGNQFSVTTIEPDYADYYGLEFVTGRNVREDIEADRGKVYINEAALVLLGFENAEDAINQELSFPRENVWVIGVVKDFHIASVKEPVDPAIFHYRPEDWPFGLDNVSVRFKGEPNSLTIEQLGQIYKDVFPGDVFDYFLMDEHFEEQYKSDITFGRLFGLFALLAIIIANLGLFGLTSFTILRRLKEMSVRKVLGANSVQIMVIFIRDFALLLVLAIVIALPASFMLAENWLTNFAQRMNIAAWVLVVPVLAVLVITLFSICLQSLKASRANPVRYLRSE